MRCSHGWKNTGIIFGFQRKGAAAVFQFQRPNLNWGGGAIPIKNWNKVKEIVPFLAALNFIFIFSEYQLETSAFLSTQWCLYNLDRLSHWCPISHTRRAHAQRTRERHTPGACVGIDTERVARVRGAVSCSALNSFPITAIHNKLWIIDKKILCNQPCK